MFCDWGKRLQALQFSQKKEKVQKVTSKGFLGWGKTFISLKFYKTNK